MSEYTDDLVERIISGYMSYKPPKRQSFQRHSGNYKWRSRSGQVLNMTDMSEQHLNNCISLCKKTNNTGKLQQLQEVLAHKRTNR